MSNTGIKTRSKNLPVYHELLEEIRNRIHCGKIVPGQMVGTEKGLAQKTGISRVSVRRAMDRLVESGLVERRVGKGVFVRPPHVSTRTVQVVLPNLALSQNVRIARGVQEYGRPRGVQVQIYNARGEFAQDMETIRRLPDSQADGAVLVYLHHPDFKALCFELKQAGYPFVLVDEQCDDLGVSSVTADNYGGGYSVGKHLTEFGHRRIGFIGRLSANTVRQRMEGMRDGMLDGGFTFDRSLVVDLGKIDPLGDWAPRIGECTRQLMQRPDRPTAIFFQSDEVAAHGYRTLKTLGLSVPDDISVVGFDDNPLCQWLDPPLTTVRQPSVEMGRIALQLLSEIRNGSRKNATCHMLPVRLVSRASVDHAKNGPK